MSTLHSSYLQDRVAGRRIRTETHIDGVPKVFACFNGVNMTASATMNVTSFSDDAVGTWTANYTAGHSEPGCAAASGHAGGVAWVYPSLLGWTVSVNITTRATSVWTGATIDSDTVEVLSAGRLA